MKRNKNLLTALSHSALPLACVLIVAACARDENVSQTASQGRIPAEVEALDGNATRAIASELSSFTLYCMDEWWEYTQQMYADGLLYDKDPVTKKWNSNEPFYMSDWSSMYAYGVSPKNVELTDKVFTYPDQSFTYTNPSGSAEQTYLKGASKLGFTMEETNNKLSMTFNDLMFTLFFQGFSGFEDVELKVKSVTIHNLPNQARFTFNKNVESRGSWGETSSSEKVFYGQELATAASINATDFTDLQNEPFILFPIEPTPWDRNSETFQEAKANKHCYIEVKMQITQIKDNVKYYLWGYESGENEYESAFYPYEQMYCTSSWEGSYNGYYYLFLDDNCVDKDGTKIKPHPALGGSTEFTVSSQIEFRTLIQSHGGTVEQWGDDTEQGTITIDM